VFILSLQPLNTKLDLRTPEYETCLDANVSKISYSSHILWYVLPPGLNPHSNGALLTYFLILLQLIIDFPSEIIYFKSGFLSVSCFQKQLRWHSKNNRFIPILTIQQWIRNDERNKEGRKKV